MRSWIAALSMRGRTSPPDSVPASSEGVEGPKSVDPSPEAIRAQLAEILQSPHFDSTSRSRRFLTYVVEETLAGRAERIKAFSIATDVFGRDASFDAHSDPIVRLEAARLRRALEQYYLVAGQGDPLVITIPKGAYVPSFRLRRVPSAELDGTPAARRSIILGAIAVIASAVIVAGVGIGTQRRGDVLSPAVPRVLVRPFDDLSGSGSSASFTKGLRQEIIQQVSKFRDIVTVEGRSGGTEERQARYVLAGNVNLDDTKVRLQARVLRTDDATVLWAQSYEADFEPSQVIAIERDIARKIATALGQPYGVIFKADSERSVPNSPDDWTAYSCTLSYYAYRANLDAEPHPQIRKCLEDAVARFPSYATAWALLAQTYIDEIRFGYPVDASTSPASLERVIASANRAVELDPQNVRALQSKMLALYFDKQLDAALAIGKRAMDTNPNDTELMGEYGSRLADSGQWDRGCRLIAEALDRNPGPSGYYETILSICAYIRQDYKAAAVLVRKAAVMDSPAYHLIAAGIFAEGGLAEEAAAERRWLMTRAPDFVTNVRSWPGLKNVQPEDRDRFLASLRKAGLPVAP
jgi:TolB-like protein